MNASTANSINFVHPDKGLVLHQVSKRFGTVGALDQLSLNVAPKEFLAIIGPTGCGKTTMLRLIAGLERLSSGHI